MTTTYLQSTEYKSLSDDCGNSTTNSIEIQKYKEMFGQTPIFNSVKPREKGGFKGWNESDKLKSVNEINFLLSRKRNIAIRLGVETDRGYTICFDKESYGNVPDSVIERIEEYAVISWESQSGGYNNLLTVTQEAYEYLDRFKEKVTFDGEKHDLEVLTSGYALVPPSRIDDESAYQDLQTYPEAPTVEIDSIREILDSIPIEEKEDQSKGKSRTNGSSSESDIEYSSLPSDFDVNQYYDENIPGTDSFRERLHHVIYDIDRVNELWFAEPEDRSENELALRRELAWYFFADKKIVQYTFEKVLPGYRDTQLKYFENKTHRNDVLDFEEYVSRPYYTNALSFYFRIQLAQVFLEKDGIISTKEIYDENIMNIHNSLDEYSESHIRRGCRIFSKMDLIERISDTEYRNKTIDNQYMKELEELKDYNEYKATKYNY